uniref:Type I-A CRISPR-associated protein Cas5 n=1 Tax=Ignisphaera aggregans TaxID=334771 RepID=A0A7C4BDD5_9CREN
MAEHYFALIELQTFSPISISAPLTYLSSPAYPLPPPTTLMGALAYPTLRDSLNELEQGCSTAEKLLEHVTYAVAGAGGYIISRSIERMYNTIYQKPNRWIIDKTHGPHPLRWSILVAGYAQYLNNSLYVLYISKDKKILHNVYGISRVGKKEGVVSIERVLIDEVNKYIVRDPPSVIETIFYTPSYIAECQFARLYSMPMLHKNNFCRGLRPQLQDFYVPLELGRMVCRVLGDAIVLNIEDLSIIIPEGAVR